MEGKSVIVISGPSGVGKTSVLNELKNYAADLVQVITYTTRLPRLGEVPGVHYNFVSGEEFDDIYNAGEFVESAEVYGKKYGVSKTAVEEIINRKERALLSVNWEGFVSIKKVFLTETVGFFLLPPSKKELHRRILMRSTDSQEEIDRRMYEAKQDMSHAGLFDYQIINNDITDTARQIAEAIEI